MTVKSEILFLAHRIPYPPDKGDKIRSWRLFSHLLEKYDVHLGCFIDDPDDWRHVDYLRSRCKGAHFVKLNPLFARMKSAGGLLTGAPLSMPYYMDSSMRQWVEKTRKKALAAEVVFSSSMAPYIEKPAGKRLRIVDLCDADSAKWSQYAETKSGPMAWVYAREGRLLSRAERDVIGWADAAFAISDSEAKTLAPSGVHWFGNGVDAEFFDPQRKCNALPAPADIVFIGAMDYWANIDAARWFLENCFPAIRQARPETTIAIVGARPPESLLKLNGRNGVMVTDRVDDIRPWLSEAKVVAAPMRIARGVQNKVLEAMAMGKAIVATSDAAEGIEVDRQDEIVIADSPQRQSAEIVSLLQDHERRTALGVKAREKILSDYTWKKQLQRFDDVVDPMIEDQLSNSSSSASRNSSARSSSSNSSSLASTARRSNTSSLTSS